jgi:RND family efflux transporter MFP subunit
LTRSRLIALALALVVAAALAALVLLRRPAVDDADSDVQATATITTAPIRSERLEDVTTLYGVVQADPAGSHALAAPRALIVEQVLARAGQTVAAGTPLVVVANAPAAALAYRQSADAAASAKTDLARVQRLYDDHLAASDQLIAAKKTLADANAALAAQQQQGAGAMRQTLAANEAGVVVSVAVAGGDHVAQDAPMMVLARQGALSVKLAIEPSAGAFAAGDAATIRPGAGGSAIATRLVMVGRAADPATRMGAAIASLAGAALPIGSAVTADVMTGAHQGLAVPRSAVVFDETGPHVFVIAGGKAQRVFVTAGHDHGDEIEVSGQIQAGQVVAVQGAYELQDGMAVKVGG